MPFVQLKSSLISSVPLIIIPMHTFSYFLPQIPPKKMPTDAQRERAEIIMMSDGLELMDNTIVGIPYALCFLYKVYVTFAL